MQEIQVFQNRIFSRLYKRLHTNQKANVGDSYLRSIPNIVQSIEEEYR